MEILTGEKIMGNIDKSYPLAELHRHLDGNVRLKTILEIGIKYNLGLPADTLEGLRPYVQVSEPKPSILSFFEKFEWLTKVIVDYDTCSRIAYENVADAEAEGIDYIELRFSPLFMSLAHHLDPAGITEAVVDGVRRGMEDFTVQAKLIGIISRTYGVDEGYRELEAILSQKDHIIAIDLAGDEKNFPPDLFQGHFKKARDAGLHSCPHAGEVSGPESIWQAINLLGAERLGHAVTATKDEKLMDYLAINAIGIESNLTSNVQTSTVPSYRSHPLKAFLAHGIKATINTDDPGISAIDIEYEYDVAAVKAGLSLSEIHAAQRNAFDCAFLTDEERTSLINNKNKKESVKSTN
jgi:adenosine deaminase